jgi:hypothetical protein
MMDRLKPTGCSEHEQPCLQMRLNIIYNYNYMHQNYKFQ